MPACTGRCAVLLRDSSLPCAFIACRSPRHCRVPEGAVTSQYCLYVWLEGSALAMKVQKLPGRHILFKSTAVT